MLQVPGRPSGALVASSYGSVYGWLTDDARQLCVSDGVSLRDYGTSSAARRRACAAGDSRRSTRRPGSLREAVSAIATFYDIDPGR